MEVLGFRTPKDVSAERLAEFDWGQVWAQLVYSVPGMHPVSRPNGLAMLANRVSAQYGHLSRDRIHLECQGSSLGGLEPEWLRTVLECAAGSLPAAKDQPGSPGRSDGKWKQVKNDREAASGEEFVGRLKIVFPTMSYVLNSPEGPAGFGTIFCQPKHWENRRYPRKLFYQCQSCHGSGRALHTKIISCAETYHYIGSANFTPSAWGKFVKGRTSLMVANYELGVLVPADADGGGRDGDDLAHTNLFPHGKFPYPYRRPLIPYNPPDDIPWMQDLVG